MSTRWPGGIINQTAPVPSGPYQDSTAPGVWTLEQQAYFKQQGLWPTFGNVNPDAFIENLFSTYLYTGNGSTQTINNGINVSGNGGLVWVKGRNETFYHRLASSPGPTLPNYLASNATDAASSGNGNISAFTTSGFTVNNNSGSGGTNSSGINYASWTFRKQPKFFDIVTYTGNGSGSGRTISHNLGSAPGMIILKVTNLAGDDWYVYHRSIPTRVLALNSTAITDPSPAQFVFGNGTTTVAPTSTNFTIGSTVNQAYTYVAYLFAHDAGGFGLNGTDNVISCGSFTTDASGNADVDLGYEPQFVMTKSVSSSVNWYIADIMRGTDNSNSVYLIPNTSSAELSNGSGVWIPTATGLKIRGLGGASNTQIYMAIRRPMAVPTVATTVFNPVYGQSGAPGFRSSNFNAGMDTSFAFLTSGYNDGTNAYQNLQTRLIGLGQLQTGNARAEVSQSYNLWDYMNGQNNTTFYSPPWGSWMFKRASGFHDVVCYTGTGSATTQAHNLGVAPELMIVKSRSNGALGWYVYSTGLGPTKCNQLNQDVGQFTSSTFWNDTAPTSSVFSLGSGGTNGSGNTQVAYLFATCPGVSKVGSYTGNGALTTINCGFTGGARFVLIKRTDSTGDWYVWDTARGMIAGTNPSLTLNTYAAEVNANSVYTIATGFQLLASPAVPVNNSGASYIFLAIA